MKVKAYVYGEGGPLAGYTFDCPGCGMMHAIRTSDPRGHNWTFNGDVNKPTFSPSLLVKGTVPVTDDEVTRIMAGEKIDPNPLVYHSFINDGKIQFLGDCTHALRGQTVELPEI